MKKVSPIVIFVYRRLSVKKTIESIKTDIVHSTSDLYIFSDGYKNDLDELDVIKVREYLKTINGFKSVTIIESDRNKGLANSIMGGVVEMINKYHKVIVLEDDLIVSNDFLEYMNDALEFYKNDRKIWSISGYTPKLPCLADYDKDLYLSPRGASWGWATWKDRWDSVDWDAKDFKKLKHDKKMRKDFELGGNDMYKMLELQMLGKIDSWAIRWCFSQFLQDKYTVYPGKSKIVNNGFNDSKGTHIGGASYKWDVVASNMKVNFENLKVKENIIQCWKNYYDINWFTKIGYFLKKNGGYKLIKTILN